MIMFYGATKVPPDENVVAFKTPQLRTNTCTKSHQPATIHSALYSLSLYVSASLHYLFRHFSTAFWLFFLLSINSTETIRFCCHFIFIISNCNWQFISFLASLSLSLSQFTLKIETKISCYCSLRLFSFVFFVLFLKF